MGGDAELLLADLPTSQISHADTAATPVKMLSWSPGSNRCTTFPGQPAADAPAVPSPVSTPASISAAQSPATAHAFRIRTSIVGAPLRRLSPASPLSGRVAGRI